jgi:hypothetical protein
VQMIVMVMVTVIVMSGDGGDGGDGDGSDCCNDVCSVYSPCNADDCLGLCDRDHFWRCGVRAHTPSHLDHMPWVARGGGQGGAGSSPSPLAVPPHTLAVVHSTGIICGVCAGMLLSLATCTMLPAAYSTDVRPMRSTGVGEDNGIDHNQN